MRIKALNLLFCILGIALCAQARPAADLDGHARHLPDLNAADNMPRAAHTRRWYEQIQENFNVRANLAFESELVERGAKKGQKGLIPAVELGFPILDAQIYAGMTAVVPFGSGSEYKATNFISPYLGVAYKITDMLTTDAGFIYRWYTRGNVPQDAYRNSVDRQREFYLGAHADMILNPAFYVFYNIDLKQWVFEPSFSHTFNLEKHFGLKKFFAEVYLYGGFLHATAFNGNQRAANVKAHKNSYWYGGVELDLRYQINEYFYASVGPRFACNNDRKGSGSSTGTYSANVNGGPRTMFWLGAMVGMDL